MSLFRERVETVAGLNKITVVQLVQVPPLGLRVLVGLTALMTVVVLVLSVGCWKTYPVGDDYGTPLFWSILVERQGLHSLMLPPQGLRYRPFEAMLMYLFQVAPGGSVLFRVHLMHFLCFAAYLFATMCFARRVGLPRGAVIVAGVVAAMHPVQIACYGGLDNYSVHALFAIMFGGMTLLTRHADRPIAVALISFATTLFASFFKEYGFGTFFFAPLIVCFFGTKRRVRHAVIAAAGAAAAVFINQGLKHVLLPADLESQTPAFRPLAALAYNLALYGSGSLFFGSTLDLMTRGGLVQKAIMAGLVGLVVLFLAAGLWRMLKTPDEPNPDPSNGPLSGRRLLLFLVLAFVPVVMPNLILMRISEVYLPGVVAILSMLLGLAFVGLAARGGAARRAGLAVLVVLLGFAGHATFGKAQALGAIGERARQMMDAVDDAVPAEMSTGRIGVIFPNETAKAYSVFAAHDADLLSERALWWKRRDSRVLLTIMRESEADSMRDDPRYDRILRYDPRQRTCAVIRP